MSGYASEAFAIDRGSFDGGFVSDARPGYGAERRNYGSERAGYGAEREYYGAENRHARHPRDGHGHSSWRQTGRSFIEFDDSAYDERDGESEYSSAPHDEGGVFPGFGNRTSGSFVYYGDTDDNGAKPDLTAASAARVIDVGTESLDRQVLEPATATISFSGTTKIIRIASSRTGGSEASAPHRPALEPWTEGWHRYCRRAHPNFDPQRGTFAGPDGATQFCTGE